MVNAVIAFNPLLYTEIIGEIVEEQVQIEKVLPKALAPRLPSRAIVDGRKYLESIETPPSPN